VICKKCGIDRTLDQYLKNCKTCKVCMGPKKHAKFSNHAKCLGCKSMTPHKTGYCGLCRTVRCKICDKTFTAQNQGVERCGSCNGRDQKRRSKANALGLKGE